MLTNKSQSTPFKVGEVVYLRVKITQGFDEPARYVNRGTEEKPSVFCERGPELAWVQLVDKKGIPVTDVVYGVPPEQMIFPSVVLADMKETKR